MVTALHLHLVKALPLSPDRQAYVQHANISTHLPPMDTGGVLRMSGVPETYVSGRAVGGAGRNGTRKTCSSVASEPCEAPDSIRSRSSSW